MAYAGYYDSLVLHVMCDEPGPWIRDELVGEVTDRVDAEDALNRLLRRGLVIRMKGGLLATTAVGRYANALSQERG